MHRNKLSTVRDSPGSVNRDVTLKQIVDEKQPQIFREVLVIYGQKIPLRDPSSRSEHLYRRRLVCLIQEFRNHQV